MRPKIVLLTAWSFLTSRKHSSSNSSGTDEERHTYLDALASTLARLDEREYKKALFRDANSILENILFPMSFPWAHSAIPNARNLPRDIDEIPAIQTIDDAEHETCALKHSNFDLHQSQVGFVKKELLDDGEEIPAVARRSEQPGEIELITCAPSIASNGNGPSPDTPATEDNFTVLFRDPLVQPVPRATEPATAINATSPSQEVDVNQTGELSYQVFEHVQEKKRRKLEAGMARLKTLKISVKVDSTSSRRALFNKSSQQTKSPLLLPAVLPEGFRYVPRGKNASRIPHGRSQLTWMEKVSNRTSHRVSFKSYLTSEKIENGAQKRPREVTVGIKVNGKLLSSPQITADQLTKDSLGSKRKRADGKSLPIYSAKIVSDAVKETEAGDHKVGKRLCSMDTEEFTKRILSRELTKEKSIGWNKKVTVKEPNVVYVTPRVDCVPSEDGLIHVVCTSAGALPPANLDEVLNHASLSGNPSVCTVCWRTTSVTGETVSECSDCRVLVHLKCCQSSMSYDARKRKCASCFANDASSTSPGGPKKTAASLASPASPQKTATPSSSPGSPKKTGTGPFSAERNSRRSSRTPTKSKDGGSPMSGVQPLSCALCPHSGGVMSMVKRGGKTLWVHDVCRIWCDQSTKMPNGSRSSNGKGRGLYARICAVCGSTDSDDHSGIAKCAAAGCSVYFHPMCALYVSKCEEIGNTNLSQERASNTNDSPKEAPTPGTDSSTTVDGTARERIIEDDTRLCKQYSFRFAKCAIPESHAVRNPSISLSVLPVCFCGIHNPDRDRSLYGLYPGGTKMVDEEVMRVPSQKVVKKDLG